MTKQRTGIFHELNAADVEQEELVALYLAISVLPQGSKLREALDFILSTLGQGKNVYLYEEVDT